MLLTKEGQDVPSEAGAVVATTMPALFVTTIETAVASWPLGTVTVPVRSPPVTCTIGARIYISSGWQVS